MSGIIVICGPTGVGKTAAAIEAAEAFGGEVVGADSMQVYQYMHIGTAAPTMAERRRVKHHLVDFVRPDCNFDAARYAASGRRIIRELQRRRVVPVVAGGTGLYVKSLLHGLVPAPPQDPRLRRRLEREAAEHGARHLYERLCALDPETASGLHPNDAARIVRALEVYSITGEPLRGLQHRHRFGIRHLRALKIGLWTEREALYRRIDARVERMVRDGLLCEVERLLACGYHPSLKSLQSIGYRHMIAYIQGAMTWEQAVATLKRDTRRYAKRQMTWFAADPEVVWIEAGERENLLFLAGRFLKGKGAPQA